MFGARGRAAGLGRLHRKPAQQQSLDQLPDGRRVPAANAGRVGHHLAQPPLHHRPRRRMNRLAPHEVSQNPVRAGGNLGDEVRVSPGIHLVRRGANHLHVRHHRGGRRALEGLLGALVSNRGSESGVAVHRSRRGDAHIGATRPVGGQLGQVVNRARTHRDRNGRVAAQRRFQFRHKTVLGIQIRRAKDKRLELRMPRGAKRFGHRLPRRPEGVLVCHDDRRLPAKLLLKDPRRGASDPDANFQVARLARCRQRLSQGESFHACPDIVSSNAANGYRCRSGVSRAYAAKMRPPQGFR